VVVGSHKTLERIIGGLRSRLLFFYRLGWEKVRTTEEQIQAIEDWLFQRAMSTSGSITKQGGSR